MRSLLFLAIQLSHSSNNQPSLWTAPTVLYTGLSDDLWNKTSWIGGGNMLRREFPVAAAPIGSTTVYIAAAGFYDLFLNGIRISNDMAALQGYWTVYDRRVLYDTYTIPSSYFRPATSNVLSIVLGSAWRDASEFPPLPSASVCDKTYDRLVRVAMWSQMSSPSLFSFVVGTDAAWQVTSKGPLVYDRYTPPLYLYCSL